MLCPTLASKWLLFTDGPMVINRILRWLFWEIEI